MASAIISGKIISVPVDLSALISAGALPLCQPDVPAEVDLFIQYAARFGSDGEAMCLALAENRGWLLATDDKEATKVGQQAGMQTISTPELLKGWSVKAAPDAAAVAQALADIELYARFRPNPAMAEFQWWCDQTAS